MAVRALIQPPPLQIIKKSIQVSECWKLWIIKYTVPYLDTCIFVIKKKKMMSE